MADFQPTPADKWKQIEKKTSNVKTLITSKVKFNRD